MACKNCVDVCCHERKEKPELVHKKHCVVPPGIYENVTVEIDENCQVVRLVQSPRYNVVGCDPCR